MGSRGWKRQVRVARSKIRAARRAAMIGAANVLPANHLDIMRATREVRGHFAGLSGLLPLDLKWPETISCLHPPLVQGSIGGKPRMQRIDWTKRQYFLGNSEFECLFWRDAQRNPTVEVTIRVF